MKSIKQQYIDLQEGNMSQMNFMRNLRMTLPQYVTNVTSFDDSVKILKNKGILTEADTKPSEGKWKTVTGKDLYAHFKEIDNLNGQEVLIGIDYEMQKNENLTKKEATKIVIKNLKKNPIYYTAQDLSGVEGYEPGYIGGKSSNAEARQMQPLEKNLGNIVDKKMGMQPVKDVERVKKDSNKGGEANKTEKGVSLMSLIAKSVRGLKKMDATGEKMKKITVKEAKLSETPGKISQQISTYIALNPTLKQYSDDITLQSNPDGFLRFGYWKELPSDVARALSLQFNIQPDHIDADEDTLGGTFYMLTPKHKIGDVDLGGSFNKFKDQLKEMIRKEITGAYGGDAMDPEDGSSYVNEAEGKSWVTTITTGRNLNNQNRVNVKITDMGDEFRVESETADRVYEKADKNYPNIQPLTVNIPGIGFGTIPTEIADELFGV